MGELSKLPNIGPVVEAQLEEVGITTYAILGIPKSQLPADRKEELKEFYRQFK